MSILVVEVSYLNEKYFYYVRLSEDFSTLFDNTPSQPFGRRLEHMESI